MSSKVYKMSIEQFGRSCVEYYYSKEYALKMFDRLNSCCEYLSLTCGDKVIAEKKLIN